MTDGPETPRRSRNFFQVAADHEASAEMPRLRALLAEWDAEVKEHGIWTSGHSIAAQIVSLVRAGAKEPAQ